MEKNLSKVLLHPSPQYSGILSGLHSRQEHPRTDSRTAGCPVFSTYPEPREEGSEPVAKLHLFIPVIVSRAR